MGRIGHERARQTIVEVPTFGDLVDAVQPRLDALGVERVFFVCGQHTTTGELEALAAGREHVRFSGFSPNPREEEVLRGLDALQSQAFDLIFAIGGGSAIDVAKAIKMQAVGGGGYRVSLPLWAAPTTAGTGSESTPFAVVYVDGVKTSIDDPALLPDVAYLCAELIITTPPYHRKSAYLDAMCQAMESIWAKAATKESQEAALQALRHLLNVPDIYFEVPVEDVDLGDAAAVLRGANLAGQAIAVTRTTAPHAMSYALTAKYGIAHGHAVALCLPPIARVHASCPQSAPALRVIAEALGLEDGAEVGSWMEKLVTRMELERPAVDHAAAESLSHSVDPLRLGNNPVELNGETLRDAYLEGLGPSLGNRC